MFDPRAYQEKLKDTDYVRKAVNSIADSMVQEAVRKGLCVDKEEKCKEQIQG